MELLDLRPGAINLRRYAAGDGSISTTAFRDALAQITATKSELIIPDGTYLVDDVIDLPEALTKITAGKNAVIVQTSNKPIFYKAGVSWGSTVNIGSTISVGARFVSVPSGHGFAVGDWVYLRSQDLTPGVTAGSRVAMWRQINQVSATVIYWDAAVYRDMTNTVTARAVTLGQRVTFEGGQYTHTDQGNSETLMEFLNCFGPDFHGVTIRDSGGPGVRLVNCIGGSWNDSHIYNLTDDIDNGHAGYGIVLSGACRGFCFNSGSVGRVRHAITTTTASSGEWATRGYSYESTINIHGEPENPYYGPVYCYNTSNAALDCHEQGFGIRMVPNVHGCFEGVLLRCSDAFIDGGQILNSRRNAIRTDYPASNSSGTGTQRFRLSGTHINNVALDGSGGDESACISIESAAELRITAPEFFNYRRYGINATDANSKVILDGGELNGGTASAQTAIRLASSDNIIRRTLVRNNAIGIREEAGQTGNSWNYVDFRGNTDDESRAPAYDPGNVGNTTG